MIRQLAFPLILLVSLCVFLQITSDQVLELFTVANGRSNDFIPSDKGNIMQSQNTYIKLISIKEIIENPKNPRLAQDEKLIEEIADSYKKVETLELSRAIKVYRKGEGYCIIDGHHRFAAAKKAMIKEIPCIICEIDEEAAEIESVVSNIQNGLSPLEFGYHLFKHVPKGEPGRGKKGGLSDYARETGKSLSRISQLRDAGEVYNSIKNLQSPEGFSDKAEHLSHIYKTDRTLWSIFCEALIDKNWSSKDVSKIAKFVQKIEQPDSKNFSLEEFLSFVAPHKNLCTSLGSGSLPRP